MAENKPMTMGEFRKATAGVPDDAILIYTSDPLAEWCEQVNDAWPCAVDTSTPGNYNYVSVRKRVTKKVNGVILFVGNA